MPEGCPSRTQCQDIQTMLRNLESGYDDIGFSIFVCHDPNQLLELGKRAQQNRELFQQAAYQKNRINHCPTCPL